MGANIQLAVEAVRAGQVATLIELLEHHDADQVIQQLGAWLWSASPGIALEVVARLEQAEDDARRMAKRLAGLGAREKSLAIAERRAAETRLKIQREIGSFLRALPDDPGGRGREVEDGDEPPTHPKRQAKAELGITRQEAHHLVKLAEQPEERFEAFVDDVREGRRRVPKSVQSIVSQVSRGGWSSDECYTPSEWLDAVRVIFDGPIRFDPASNFAAQAGLVRAEGWCSLEPPELGERERNLAEPLRIEPHHWAHARATWRGKDGLQAEWPSDWWCNPPFAAEPVRAFHKRFEAERVAGRRGVVMLNADPNNAAQLELLRHCLVAWPKGRISYWAPTGARMESNRAAQVLFGINVAPADWERGLAALAVLGRPW